MQGSVKRLEKWLQREVGDPKLRLQWSEAIGRYVVGRLVTALASDFVDWFMVVSDGNDGYRPIDQRLVRKIISLDTWRREKQMTSAEFTSKLEQEKLDRAQERSKAIAYRLKHEARYIKKAAVKDGLLDGLSRVVY